MLRNDWCFLAYASYTHCIILKQVQGTLVIVQIIHILLYYIS